MQVIPLTPTPSQTLTATLGGQNCKINVYQKSTGLYLDLFVNNIAIVSTALCLDRACVTRRPYTGFAGSLVFCDTQGLKDPTYTGLGTRYLLCYLGAAEL